MEEMCPILFSPICTASRLMAQTITSLKIGSLAAGRQKASNRSGIAIRKDGKLVHTNGYSAQLLATDKKVDEHALFRIASNTKAFSSAASGILIDEVKPTRNSKVTDFIPQFKLYYPT